MTLVRVKTRITEGNWDEQTQKEGFYYIPFRLKGRDTRRERLYTHGLLFAFGRLNQHTTKQKRDLSFNDTWTWGLMLRMEVNSYVMEWLFRTIPSRRG